MKILDLEITHDNEGDIFWVDKDTEVEILMSIKRNKFGSSSDRIVLLKENSLLLPQFNYLARVDSSMITTKEENIIGAAIVNGKIIIQINSAGDIYQLVRDYKEEISQERYEEIKMEYNL